MWKEEFFMNTLHDNSPIRHALIWIAIYVGLVNITSNMSVTLTSVAVFLLGVGIFFYLIRNNWLSLYKFHLPDKQAFRQSLYFLPLLLLILCQFAKGIHSEIGMTGFLQAILLMAGVGFVEEVVFRGFLYQAISKKSGPTRAILISGVTFGIGHIVNIFQGYNSFELAIQISAGILLGMILAIFVSAFHSIIPGIFFHILFNISGTITNENQLLDGYISLFILGTSLLYLIYLIKLISVPFTRRGSI